jgi:Domain of unknown function (DUF6531)
MHKILLLLSIFSLTVLQAGESSSHLEEVLNNPEAPLANDEGVPSALVYGCVNVITGDFQYTAEDLALAGSNPLVLQRTYCSNNHSEEGFYHGWGHNLHGSIHQYFTVKHNYASTRGNVGGEILYKVKCRDPRKKHWLEVNPESLKKGVTNCVSGTISGKTNIKNNKIFFEMDSCQVHLGDGRLHQYKCQKKRTEIKARDIEIFSLEKTLEPNGNQVHYVNAAQFLSKVYSTDSQGGVTNTINFVKESAQDTQKIKINTPEGRSVHYTFKKFTGKHGSKKVDAIRWRLVKAEKNDGPTESYVYEEPKKTIERMSRKELPEGRFLNITYYNKGESDKISKDRVKCLSGPIGTDSTALPIYTFSYDKDRDSQKGFVSVKDALNHQTVYQYSTKTHRLYSITHDLGTSSYQRYTKERFYWDEDEYSPDYTNILSKTIEDANGKVLSCQN